MIGWISSWAANIVIAVIIATIIEMILPESNNKKYVKTVIGIFILFTIISPVITKISGEEISLFKISENLKLEDNNTQEVIAMKTNNNIEQVYVSNLKADVANKVNEKGYAAKEINIDVNMEETEYGRINKISFRLKKNDINKENKQKEINDVNEINISINKEIKEETDKELDNNITQEEYRTMQEYIASAYRITLEKVNVY